MMLWPLNGRFGVGGFLRYLTNINVLGFEVLVDDSIGFGHD